MDILIIIMLVIPAVITTVIARVDEAHAKHDIRKENGIEDYPLLGAMSIMPLSTFILTLPVFFYIDYQIDNILTILVIGVFARFIPWVIMATMIGKYIDAMHQASSNFTLYENFAGPIGGLLTFAIYNYTQNPEISIFWYIATPAMGLFMIWAMREDDDKKMSPDLIKILVAFFLMVSIESAILLFCLNYIPTLIENPILTDFEYINDGMLYFMAIISISSLLASTYFSKQLIRDVKGGYGKIVTRLGFINSISEFFYFLGFTLFGPIFLIVRRGLIIPIQNLYLAFKEGVKIKDSVVAPLKKPIMALNGGKDFIISFVDLVFNNVIKFIIKLLG